ncbi:MAG: class I SAM-dependent methyltransferase [Cyanobacteria bacterium J06636_16]
MMEISFDFDQVFDNDYLYFYETFLTPERNREQTDLIVKLLAIEPRMEILDLACGHGRIANELAQSGHQVTGLDASEIFLEHARNRAAAIEATVHYVLGDMRNLPWTSRFDRIINWFTAYGYFDDHDNRRVLTETYGALKPGGQLLIEHQNRDRLLTHFRLQSVVEHPQEPGNFLLEDVQYDALSGRTHTKRTIIRDGNVRTMHYSVRLFTFPELKDWLHQAGFATVEGYSNSGSPFALDSRRMIVIATK